MMEKTINCAECDIEFKYEVPTNYPDKRKYCFRCSEEKKARWADKDKDIPAASQVEKLMNQPKDDKQTVISALALTKAWAQSGIDSTVSREDVLETYNYFLKEL